VLVVVAVVVVAMVVADCFDWRSEAFLEFLSIYESILENRFNSKYCSTTSSIQSEIFNNSGVSASTFIIAEL
jgi:hypothetical protein